MKKKKISRDKDKKIKIIFETFTNLINKEGYENISTRLLAETSNISIGTIYRYFPQGKPSILSSFLDESFEKIFKYESLLNLSDISLPKFINLYVHNHIQSHREFFEIHKALDQALLANKELFKNLETTLNEIFKNVTVKLKETDMFKNISEKILLENLTLLYNLCDGIIHRHIFIMPLFETDEELK